MSFLRFLWSHSINSEAANVSSRHTIVGQSGLRRLMTAAAGVLNPLWCWIPLFPVFGVPLYIHTTALLFPCGFLLARAWPLGGWGGMGWVLALLILLVGSLLIHEFAHVLVARQYGLQTRRVVLLPFGCLAELDGVPRHRGEIWIAAAGPAASAALAAVLWGCALGLQSWPAAMPPLVALLKALAFANLVMALFNLLPFFPMDGGRILRALLTMVLGGLVSCSAERARLMATRIAVRSVARALALVWIFATFAGTRFWWHLPAVAFLLLVGEAEFLLLRDDASAPVQAGNSPLSWVDPSRIDPEGAAAVWLAAPSAVRAAEPTGYGAGHITAGSWDRTSEVRPWRGRRSPVVCRRAGRSRRRW